MRLLSLPLDTPRRDFASFPFQLGGCGLLSAMRSRVPAHWASWADRSAHDPLPTSSPRRFDGPKPVRNPPVSVILMQQPLVARCSAIVGMVPQVGGFFSQLNPKVWQLVSLGCWLFLTKVGSVMHPRSWSSSSWTLCCLGSLMTSARCSAPKEAPLRHSLSPQCRSPLNSGSISDIFRVLLRRLSLPLPCLPTLDGVAVLYCLGHHRASCALAGVLGGGVMHWSLRQHVCVVKLEIWIWLGSASRINDASR